MKPAFCLLEDIGAVLGLVFAFKKFSHLNEYNTKILIQQVSLKEQGYCAVHHEIILIKKETQIILKLVLLL